MFNPFPQDTEINDILPNHSPQKKVAPSFSNAIDEIVLDLPSIEAVEVIAEGEFADAIAGMPVTPVFDVCWVSCCGEMVDLG